MITLITGTPGAGKTLYAVSELIQAYAKEGRPLFVQGIPDLALEHSLLPAEAEWTEQRVIPGNIEGKTAPYYAYPENSVLIIDECQNSFRPRANGSKIPDIVAALETHRHTGIDFVLITQHPSRIDTAVRTLVGRHLHVRRMFGWNRAIVYEWDTATDPNRITTAIKRSWPYPKKAFKLYKSSSQHTARGNRVPMTVVVAALAILAVPAAWYYAMHRTADKFTDTKPVADAEGGAATEPATARAAFGAPPPVPARMVEAMTPTDDQNPLSAPIYAAVVPPVVAPEIKICVSSRKQCACYTQQTTPIWVPDEQCRSRAAGKYYDPYKQSPNENNEAQPERVAQAQAEPATPVPPDTISPLGEVARRAAEDARINP